MWEQYRPYTATARQLEILEAMIAHGSQRAAAQALGIGRPTVQESLRLIKNNASRRGFDPDHDLSHPTTPTQILKGTSTLYDADGNVQLQWVKTKDDSEAQQLADLLESYSLKPAPIVKAPKKTDNTLLTLYTITDYHVGMYAWAAECGEDWDTQIAGKVFYQSLQEMADKSPDSECAILNIQGDYCHWDGFDAVTPANRHLLDADTRFGRLVELSADLVIWATQLLLAKHKTVKLLICEGNHDPASAVWLRKVCVEAFRKNKRLEIDDTQFPYYTHLHGKTMLAFHHGHKMKNEKLPSLFASEPRFREMWGQAKYTYIHTGHYHHTEKNADEFGGAIVERHPTLAAKDAYAARGGYIARRAAHAIVYNDLGGEVSRVTVYPPELNHE